LLGCSVTLTPIFSSQGSVCAAVCFDWGSGAHSFIGASLGIGIVTIFVLFQNWWLAIQVAIIFMQQIKDNVLAPRLMGNFTGLIPSGSSLPY